MKVDTRKLIVFLTYAFTTVLFVLTGHITGVGGLTLLGLPVGILIGNGHNARKGRESGAMIKPKKDDAA